MLVQAVLDGVPGKRRFGEFLSGCVSGSPRRTLRSPSCMRPRSPACRQSSRRRRGSSIRWSSPAYASSTASTPSAGRRAQNVVLLAISNRTERKPTGTQTLAPCDRGRDLGRPHKHRSAHALSASRRNALSGPRQDQLLLRHEAQDRAAVPTGDDRNLASYFRLQSDLIERLATILMG